MFNLHVKRPKYLSQLIKKKENGRVKIITGIKECGKSYLLFKIFKNYLLSTGVQTDQIITITIENLKDIKNLNQLRIEDLLRGKIQKNGTRQYIFIDEINQFEEVSYSYSGGKQGKFKFIASVFELLDKPELNVDLYITGVNKKILRSDLIELNKDRIDEIKVYPLSYAEFYSCYQGAKTEAFSNYYKYGGMPKVAALPEVRFKKNYLKKIFVENYINTLIEHKRILKDPSIIDDLLDMISLSIGTLAKPIKFASVFSSETNIKISQNTLCHYLEYFIDDYIIEKITKYDIKGKKNISTSCKYYFVDIGIRNAKINFCNNEHPSVLKNIIYNELVVRGLNVNFGFVEYNCKNKNNKVIKKNLDVDFVVNRDSNVYYIQAALNSDNKENIMRVTQPLRRIKDKSRKVVIVKNSITPRYDENGILFLNVEDFLLNESVIDLF